MKLFSLLLALCAVLGVSCERHDFDGPDGTRQLHDHHSSHGHDAKHSEDHGDPHGGDHGDEHEKKTAH